MNKDVPAHICCTLETRSVQFWTAIGMERIAQEFFRDPVCRHGAGIADGDIGISRLEVQNAVGADHIKRRIGAQLSPKRQARHEPTAGESIRRSDAQRLSPSIFLDRVDRARKRCETIPDDREQACAFHCQRQRSGPSAKQRAPAVALQQTDLVTDGRWRDAKLGRSLLEAQVAGGGIEGAQFDERWQIVHAASVDENRSPTAEFFAFACRCDRRGE